MFDPSLGLNMKGGIKREGGLIFQPSGTWEIIREGGILKSGELIPQVRYSHFFQVTLFTFLSSYFIHVSFKLLYSCFFQVTLFTFLSSYFIHVSFKLLYSHFFQVFFTRSSIFHFFELLF